MKTTSTTITAGQDSHHALAAQLVGSVRGEMDYLGWFTGIVHAYPENPHDWRTAMQTAASVRLALDQAEALLRAVHNTGSQVATGASQQAAA